MIGPAVEVRVLAADVAVPGIADFTITFVHGVTEVAHVDTLSRPVAVVGLVFAGVFCFTNLQKNEQTYFNTMTINNTISMYNGYV